MSFTSFGKLGYVGTSLVEPFLPLEILSTGFSCYRLISKGPVMMVTQSFSRVEIIARGGGGMVAFTPTGKRGYILTLSFEV